MGKNPYQEAVDSLSPGGLEYRPPLVATIRDQFAMAALTALGQVFARDWHSPNEYQVKRMAECAYMVADAMLAARGGK